MRPQYVMAGVAGFEPTTFGFGDRRSAAELHPYANNLDTYLWCPEPESNQRHVDFQSTALPTELSGLVLSLGQKKLPYRALPKLLFSSIFKK